MVARLFFGINIRETNRPGTLNKINNGCLVIYNHCSCKDLVHHPIETTVKKMDGHQVTGEAFFRPVILTDCPFRGLTLAKKKEHVPLDKLLGGSSQ